ncbi:hypothetical protein [Methylocucumis oryzae]|nr:hypothetical protein [Methylocucumis oryzae]
MFTLDAVIAEDSVLGDSWLVEVVIMVDGLPEPLNLRKNTSKCRC